MDVNNVFNKYILKEDKLLKYGFKQINGQYFFKRELENKELYAEFIVTNTIFDVKVFESGKEEYLPFYIKKAAGNYIAKVKKEVNLMIEDILMQCFESCDLKDKLLAYVKEKYGTVLDFPWKNDPASGTLKTSITNKWYGLFMSVPYKCLKIEKEGRINILNVKNKPEKIKSLIDNEHYFSAYHMNKKYWITVLLDNTLEIEQVKTLLDESYQLVNNK